MTLDIQSIADRLEAVERQHLRLKGGALILFVCLGAIVLMGTARRPQTVIAQKFILTDADGTTRAELGMSGSAAHLFIYGTKEREVTIVASGDRGYGGSIELFNVDGSSRALLEGTPDGAILNLFGVDGKSRAHLGVGSIDITTPGPGKAVGLLVFGDQPGPSLRLNDRDGFAAVIGSMDSRVPETGSSQRTSAASAALVGKDGNELWSAP